MFGPEKSWPPRRSSNIWTIAGLSKYDMPEFFLQLDEIPLTASGKVRKLDIVDWIADGRAKPAPIRWQSKRRMTSQAW